MTKQSRKPWETIEGKQVWKTKSGYFNWLRGGLRKMWADYPVRKIWKKESLRSVTPQEKSDKAFHPSTKNVGQCSMCSEWMAGSKLECDHKTPSNGCSSWEDVLGFLEYCVSEPASNFQLVCKPCHRTKTYSERMNISFKDAEIEKGVIAKCKQTAKVQLTELRNAGFDEEEIKNAKSRRECYRKLLGEINNEVSIR